jgi:uncharacterized protein YidB (DUF937 family)
MGLLDSLLGKAVTVKSTDRDAVSNIFDLINNKQVGGLDGLLGKMTQGGLGKVAESWIGTGKNKSVKSGQITNVLGKEVIGQVAKKLGIPESVAAGTVAKLLPVIVDKLTPDGKISSGKSIDIQDLLGKLIKN